MKHILIKAYSFSNLGDDLFILILCQRYPHTQFYLYCREEYVSPYKNIKNLRIINPTKLDRVQKKVGDYLYGKSIIKLPYYKKNQTFDAVIHIGGSLFIQQSTWRKSLRQYTNIINSSKKFYTIGCNFGPYFSDEYFTSYYSLFEKMDDLCFRDNDSYLLFENIEQARVAPDIVFTMGTLPTSPINTNRYVVISTIDVNRKVEESELSRNYEDKILDITLKFLNEGYHVYLMGFCEYEGDFQANETLSEKIKEVIKKQNTDKLTNNLHVYNYTGDVSTALSLIEHSVGVVATRFHSMILAFLYDKNVFPIMYSGKMKTVLQDLKYDEKFSSISDIKNVDADDVFKQLTKTQSFDISAYKKESNKQFYILDKVLK